MRDNDLNAALLELLRAWTVTPPTSAARCRAELERLLDPGRLNGRLRTLETLHRTTRRLTKLTREASSAARLPDEARGDLLRALEQVEALQWVLTYQEQVEEAAGPRV